MIHLNTHALFDSTSRMRKAFFQLASLSALAAAAIGHQVETNIQTWILLPCYNCIQNSIHPTMKQAVIVCKAIPIDLQFK